MLKKNQLALILLTLVMMLTVYYIKSPFGEDKKVDDKDDTTDVTGRLEQLSLKRLTLKNTRDDLKKELDEIIASTEATVVEKNAAINERQKLNEITEKELLLELEIINKGFQDSFVHATKELVTVTIVAEEHSVSIADQIFLQTLLEFDGYSSNVRVVFQTVEEVMGTDVESE